jgi:hypothetical protein
MIKEKLVDAFGNCVDYGDSEDKWDACTVPLGSEGSVQYRVEKTSTDDCEASWGVVYIWGDLRDYRDYNAIYQWIKDSCGKLDGLWVRSCAVTIEVEGMGSYFIYSKFNDETTIVDILMMGF